MKHAIRSAWLHSAALIALCLVPAAAGIVRLTELARGAAITPENARFFAAPVPVLLHVPSAIVYGMLGALQFAPTFRQRYPTWHRAAGRVLVMCGFIAALTGLWMTLTYPWPVGDGVVLYLERLVFGSAMLLSLLMALDAIRRRNFAVHGEWMIRAYAIGMGAGTQVLTHLPYYMLVGTPDESSRAVLMGAGWVINIVIAEWIIRRPRMRRATVYATPARRGDVPQR